ncbi:MAG: hypothetical protein LBT36_04090 [Oscillospiraceae bacterium]|jgi:hypothetical protein|nr:hypothetical protein [Oscillospiraceae bacterium]
MKKQYEMTREIFNKCSGNQMRDVFFEEIESEPDALDEIIKTYVTGGTVQCERFDAPGLVVYELNTDGMKQKITFAEA